MTLRFSALDIKIKFDIDRLISLCSRNGYYEHKLTKEADLMELLLVVVVSAVFVLFFLILWLRERKKNAEKEYIAYGLRANEDQSENTKTNISAMENGFEEAMSKLEDLGEVTRDNWGQWIWTKSGKPVGQTQSKKKSA